MVFSAVTVNNRLSSLKPVNSSSTEASRISSKPLDAQESVSGQVPCFLSLGCSPAAPRWGNPPLLMVHKQGRCDPFTISLPPSFFGARTQRSLSFQIRKIAWFYLHDSESPCVTDQWRGSRQSCGCFLWCPHRPTKACRPLILRWSWPTAPGLPWFAFVAFWSGEEQSQKASKKRRTGKKVLVWGFSFPLKSHTLKAPWRLCHVQLFMHCAISKTVFKESEDLRGVGWTLYSFCLSPGSCRHHPLIFTCITCPGLHFSSSVLYHRARWEASFCPPLGN